MNKFKIITLFILSMGLANGLELNLQSLAEDGDIKIALEEKSEDTFFMRLSGLKGFDEVMIVKKKPGQFGNYSFEPFLFQGFRLYKTAKTTIYKGSKKELFEFYLAGKKEATKLIALKSRANSLASKFEREQKALNTGKKHLEQQLKKYCGKEVPIEGKLNHKSAMSIRGITDLCMMDNDYKEGIQALKLISFNNAQTELPQYKILHDKLSITSGSTFYNPRFAIKQWLEDNL